MHQKENIPDSSVHILVLHRLALAVPLRNVGTDCLGDVAVFGFGTRPA